MFMLKALRFILMSIILAGLVSCGGSSTVEVDKVIEQEVETPTDSTIEDEDTAQQLSVNDSTDDSIGDNDQVTDIEQVKPNILFIIADDQGLDASAQYDFSDDVPNTPTLNELAAQGITFDNMWVTPACSTTRATIITGKYGVNNGIESLPANLSTEHKTLQQYLKSNAATTQYQSAVFGKWHLATGNNKESHPNDVGIDYYAGNLTNLADYYDWSLTTNGITENVTAYHSTKITDLAMQWITSQTSPWFAWVAYSAPHSPFHLPPASLHDRDLSGTEDDINSNKRDYYLAAIEAMDSEIARLLSSLDAETRSNTLIIYIGDNGTPSAVIDSTTYNTSHGKGSLYQGGIATPFIVSGKGVSRINARESALVTATDLFATIAEVAGVAQTKIHDSQSFKSLFSVAGEYQRDYIYSAYQSDDVIGWTTRSANYKLIVFADGTQQLYSLQQSFAETDNLLPSSDTLLLAEVSNLASFAALIIGDDEQSITPLDITNMILLNKSQNCVDYIEQYTATVNDINNSKVFNGDLVISQLGDKCIFQTNAIPNHDFNDGGRSFPNDVSAQDDQFEITTSPIKASQVTPISLTVDNAILLNGVKVDLLAAGCFGVGNGKIGCNDMQQAWRYDPMHAANGFAVDSHNAHAQPDGTYHYHGSPLALFDSGDEDDIDDKQVSPVIGFAADGFPIFGTYFYDQGFADQGGVRAATSSYQLKAGNRPSGDGEPGGTYDGSYRDDYQYVVGLGDLDECNGMTIDGVYGYYITSVYPYVLACFSGTPDNSFTK